MVLGSMYPRSIVKCYQKIPSNLFKILEINPQDKGFEPFLSCTWPFLIRQLFYETTLHKRVQFFVSCHSHVELTRQGIRSFYFISIYQNIGCTARKRNAKPLSKIPRSLDFS